MGRILFPLFLMVATAAPLMADPRITRLVATEQRGKISVSVSLGGAFDEPTVLKAIESGVPTGFTYYVDLIRKRPNWFDKTLERVKIEVICTYNSITKEYLVNYRRNRKLVRSEVFANFGPAQERMSQIDEQDLFESRTPPSKLRVLARAEVIRSYVFYVVPWDVSTPTVETRVKKANGR